MKASVHPPTQRQPSFIIFVYFIYLFLMRCLPLDIIQLLLSASSLLSPYYHMWGIGVEGNLKVTTWYLLSLMTGVFISQELKKRSNVKLSTRKRQPPHQHQSVLGSSSWTEPGSSPFPPLLPCSWLWASCCTDFPPSLPADSRKSNSFLLRNPVGAVSPLGPGCTRLIQVLGKFLF